MCRSKKVSSLQKQKRLGDTPIETISVVMTAHNEHQYMELLGLTTQQSFELSSRWAKNGSKLSAWWFSKPKQLIIVKLHSFWRLESKGLEIWLFPFVGTWPCRCLPKWIRPMVSAPTEKWDPPQLSRRTLNSILDTTPEDILVAYFADVFLRKSKPEYSRVNGFDYRILIRFNHIIKCSSAVWYVSLKLAKHTKGSCSKGVVSPTGCFCQDGDHCHRWWEWTTSTAEQLWEGAFVRASVELLGLWWSGQLDHW